MCVHECVITGGAGAQKFCISSSSQQNPNCHLTLGFVTSYVLPLTFLSADDFLDCSLQPHTKSESVIIQAPVMVL